MRLSLDTNIYSAFKNGNQKITDILEKADEILNGMELLSWLPVVVNNAEVLVGVIRLAVDKLVDIEPLDAF